MMRLRALKRAAAMSAVALFVVVPAWATSASASGGATSRPAVAPVSITPLSLPGGTGAVPYSTQLIAAGGAGGPYTLGLDPKAARLPRGLMLSTSGAITGTPTQTGKFTFTATATDVKGNVGSRSYTITVVPGISLDLAGYVGVPQCHIAGPLSSGSLAVKPFGLGRITSVNGVVQVADVHGPVLITLTMKSSPVHVNPISFGWITVINSSDAQCSAINPIFMLGRPSRIGPAAVTGTGWFIATINDVNYTLAAKFTVVASY
jgi:hypothetical protein